MFTSTLNEELSSWCLKSPFFIGTIMAYAIRRSLLLKLLFAQLVFALKTSKVLSECHHGSSLVNESLATKTPYRFVANRDDSPPIYQGCSPIKFWSMIRHGTRNPSDGIIRRMNEHLPLIREAIIKAHREGKGSLCSHELRQLSKWSPQLEGAEEKILTHEGEDELLLLGERFQKRFPNLLPEEYSNSSFKFQFTATQRAEESARSFTVGLFGRRISKHVWFPEGIYRDPVLRFYKLCENWRKSVDKNPEASKEQRSFAKGSEMLKVQKEVTQRLGLSELLSFDDVVLIYVTCSFEMAWFPKKNSPWCAVLSDYDLKVMEYAEDLDNYWIDGYGYKINYEQACPTIKDMFNFFSSPDAKEKAIVYFSHAGAVLKMLAHLGLYRDDEPLLASNFHHMLHKRQWRVGKISSFASNIAFVLYNCGSESSVPLKILTLHQERPVRLPGCPSHEDLCSIHTFEEVFFSSIKNCDFQNICTFKSN